jgi:hypothetical protein
MNLANEIIMEMLAATKPSKEAIDEARARRDLVKEAALAYDGAISFIKSGSLAHHTITGVVSDADGSLMLDRRIYRDYGPDSEEGLGPQDLVVGIAEVIRDTVAQVYPNVFISTNHKRAIYFRFRQPLEDGQDPTVDLVIGLNRKDQPGIWIPNLDDDDWDASDPGRHTELVRARRRSTGHASSKVVRTLKLFSKQWSNELLASFHWTALMLEAYPVRKTVIQGVIDVFNHAADSLEQDDTDDPAGVSGPISMPAGRDRSVVVSRIRNAGTNLEKALQVEGDNEAALDEVLELFGNVFTKELAATALEQAAVVVRRKVLDNVIRVSSASPAAAAPVVTESFNDRPVLNTRAYAETTAPAIVAGDATAVEPDLSWFEAGLEGSQYVLLSRHAGSHKLTYTVSVPLLDHTGKQLVTVEVFGKSARVVAHGLGGLRHVNYDGSLCLWYPGDGTDRQWTISKGLVSLLDLVALHLYKETRFKETGVWLGEEVHNG